jgi:hypothetical protein
MGKSSVNTVLRSGFKKYIKPERKLSILPSLQYSSSLVSSFSVATIASDGHEFKSLSLYDCLHLFVEYRHC